jgi:hypothetical protein
VGINCGHLGSASGINVERDPKFESTSLRNDREHYLIITIL